MSRVTGIRYQSHSAAEADTLFPPTPRYSAAAARLAGGGGGIRYIAGAGTPGRDRVAPEPVEAGGPGAFQRAKAALTRKVRGATAQPSRVDPGVRVDIEKIDELIQSHGKADFEKNIAQFQEHVQKNAREEKSASLKLALHLLHCSQDYNNLQTKLVRQYELFKKYVDSGLKNTNFKLQPIDDDSANTTDTQSAVTPTDESKTTTSTPTTAAVQGGGGVVQTLENADQVKDALAAMKSSLDVLLGDQKQAIDKLLQKVGESVGMATDVFENEHMYARAVEFLIKAFAEKSSELNTSKTELTELEKQLEQAKQARQEAEGELDTKINTDLRKNKEEIDALNAQLLTAQSELDASKTAAQNAAKAGVPLDIRDLGTGAPGAIKIEADVLDKLQAAEQE